MAPSAQQAPEGHEDFDRQLLGRMPRGLQPYAKLARWDRPIGTWLLLLPCWWGLALAPGWPTFWQLLLFGLGAFIMRGAGCTINDLADRDFDGKVERTRDRPLPSGQVTFVQAMAFLFLQLLAGLVILLSMNLTAIIAGFAIVPVIVLYPFAKRYTNWPQLVLGIAFNWGVLVAYAASTGTVDLAAVALYLSGIAWTLVYDTIYAHQDREDDAIVGIRSTARLFGERTKSYLVAFAIVQIVLLILAGILAGLKIGFFIMTFGVALTLIWQIATLNIHDPMNCLYRFRWNRNVGLVVLIAIFLGKVSL